MPVTPRDFQALQGMARYFTMSRSQINALCYPTDSSGRITRRRLAALAREGIVRKHTMEVVNPARGGAIPVYHLAERGREHLAVELADDSLLLKPVTLPHALHLYHALLVTNVLITFDAAVARQQRVALEQLFHEHEIVNSQEPDPKKHYKLFTEIHHEPRVCCAPDAALLLSADDHRLCLLLEVETGKNGPRWAASRKHRGYADFCRQQLHTRFFPAATVDRTSVLSIWPTEKHRDAFLRQLRGKDGAERWRVAAASQLNARTALFENIWHRVDGEKPGPLVRS